MGKGRSVIPRKLMHRPAAPTPHRDPSRTRPPVHTASPQEGPLAPLMGYQARFPHDLDQVAFHLLLPRAARPFMAGANPMKRILLAAVLGLPTALATAQTATDFNCADCAGTPHQLFAELDAGKVVVLTWVMPCNSCVGPSLTTYNVVESYQSSHPGQVVMYLCDDYANTSCAALNNWRNAQGLTNTTTFSNAAISMSDYGSNGMPKIVVLGGSAHTVFLNVNNTVNANALQQAINNALAVTGIDGVDGALPGGLAVLPNPAGDQAWASFDMPGARRITIDLFDRSGRLLRNLHTGEAPQGPSRVALATQDLAAGTYLVRLSDGQHSSTADLTIVR
ncbi:MAG: hypothetical protein GFGODING_02443 [Flavobacteriales bacterium]|nr:hypothetical protein [Flavobacteriales bacterium]